MSLNILDMDSAFALLRRSASFLGATFHLRWNYQLLSVTGELFSYFCELFYSDFFLMIEFEGAMLCKSLKVANITFTTE